MNPLQTVILNLKSLLSEQIKNEVKTFVSLNEELILAMNRERLYQRGESIDNKLITPLYTPFTIRLKRLKGQRYNHVTLKDTGLFYDSLYIVLEENSFYVSQNSSARTQIYTDLKAKYGSLLLGLTNKDLIILRERCKEYFIKKIKGYGSS